MSVQATAYMDHKLAMEDLSGVPRLLVRSEDAIKDLQRYWLSVDASYRSGPTTWTDRWREDWLAPPEDPLRDGDVYFETGSLLLHFYKRVAVLSGPARWRGFITIPALRSGYRNVACEIAHALGSPTTIWASENFCGEELAVNGASLGDIRQTLEASWGERQNDLKDLPPQLLQNAETCTPNVWFEERVP